MNFHALRHRWLLGALFSLLPLASSATAFQVEAPASETFSYPHDTGLLENLGRDWEVIASFQVQVPGSTWMRLYFDEVELAGDAFLGNDSYLRVTSHRDGAFQELQAHEVEQWQNTSAYFNGDTVQVDIVAAPGTGMNRIVLREVVCGVDVLQTESQCGPTDDRVASTDVRAARLLPVGCTGWLIDDCAGCMLTAGHCSSSGFNVIQFNVPLSSGSGSIQHPHPDDQYAIDASSSQFTNGGVGNDWGYYGTFPNAGTGLMAADAQGAVYTVQGPPSFNPSENIRITGYGVDTGSANQTQQTHAGPWWALSGTTIQYQTDTTGGNSGSPVIHDPSGIAVGIHTHGGCGTSSGNSGTSAAHGGLQNALANPEGVCASGMQLIDPAPGLLVPGVATSFDLQVAGGTVPGTAMLHVRYTGGAFIDVPLVAGAGDIYRATLPPAVCGASPEYYVSAVSPACGLVSLPADAPLDLFTASVGNATEIFADDMESDLGWTGGIAGDTATTGVWERVDPVATAAQPGNDHTPNPGVLCWITGQQPAGGSLGTNDVDGGRTTLLSPIIDASGVGDQFIAYWRWYSNDEGSTTDDTFRVDVSNNDGASWTSVEVIGPGHADASGGWVYHSFAIANYVAPTANVRVRFVASDLGSGSIVEAGVDDFQLLTLECTASFPDCNGNGIVDSDDIASGRSLDMDLDGVPDECSGVGTPYGFCSSGAPCGNLDASAGCANSTGSGAALSASGSASVASDDLLLTASGLPTNQNGIFFMGGAQVQLPFGDGLQVVGSGGLGLFRYPVSNSGATGVLSQGPGIVAHSQGFSAAGRIVSGSTWYFQAWYRDPSGPCGSAFNTSNGLSVTFVP